MTYGDDSGQPQYPQQGYGQFPPQPRTQQYPQGQPRQPQQYDPGAHQRRIQGPPQEAPWQQPPYPQQGPPPLPQGQSWQPGYGQQPYMPPQPPRRKSWPARHKVLTGFLAFCGLAFVIGIAAAASSPSSPTAASSTPAAPPTQTQAAASATPLPNGGQQYASDMQAAFSFDSTVSDSQIANFGQQTCQDLQSGSSIAKEVPTAQQAWTNITPGDAIQMITLAEKDMCPTEQSAQTVTYVVTGASGAQVTYGPSGSNLSGTVPMSVTQPLGNPSYYAISAQLQGYGDIGCKLEVDGVTISSGTASGGYNIADCEIGQNPTTGSWENDNSG
jgi:Protein of unknown function (DUF732)